MTKSGKHEKGNILLGYGSKNIVHLPKDQRLYFGLSVAVLAVIVILLPIFKESFQNFAALVIVFVIIVLLTILFWAYQITKYRKQSKNIQSNILFPPDLISDNSNNEGINKIKLPIFEVDGNNLSTIKRWNKACLDFYDIEIGDYDNPEKYDVHTLFFKDKAYYSDERLFSHHQNKYLELKEKRSIPQHGIIFSTAFYGKIENAKQFFRKTNRISSIMVEPSENGNWWVTILMVPVEYMCNKNAALDYIDQHTKQEMRA